MSKLIDSGFIYWILLFLLVSGFDIIIVFASLKQNQKVGPLLRRTILAAAATTVFYTGSILFEDYFLSSVFSSFYFIGVDFILVFMLQMVLFLVGHESGIFGTKQIKSAFTAVLSLDCISLLLNPFYENAISYYPIDVGSHIIYKYHPHLLYESHLIFCYLMVAMIILVLLRKIVNVPRVYRTKYSTILGIFALDIILNALYLAGSRFVVLDISVLFYSISAVLIYYAIFWQIPRVLLNTTRVFIMENLDWPLISLDYENKIIDINRSAGNLFPEIAKAVEENGEYENADRYFETKGFPPVDQQEREFEWQSPNEDAKIFRCQRHNFYDPKKRLIGTMIAMRDVSYSKDLVTGLDMMAGLHRYLRSIDYTANAPVKLLIMNINGLGVINSALGREKGDLVMNRTVQIARSILGNEVYMARMDDGSIIAVLLKADSHSVNMLANYIKNTIARENSIGISFNIEFGVSGLKGYDSEINENINEAITSMKNRKLLSGDSHESSLISSLSQALIEKDYETKEHVSRTKEASMKMAAVMGLSDKDASALAILCIVHDIGKIGVPNEILLKPGKLTDEEWEIMKSHSEKGYRIAMASSELRPIAESVLSHHERWDGNGYPNRLAGERIPQIARIISVLDSFDVMTHDRPYHKAMSIEDAKAELLRCRGTQFDPTVVDCFLKIADEIYGHS